MKLKKYVDPRIKAAAIASMVVEELELVVEQVKRVERVDSSLSDFFKRAK